MKLRLILIFFWLVILVLNVAIQAWMLISIFCNTKRAVQIAVAYDKLGNVACGQGYETLSSWWGRHGGWGEELINKLFFVLTGEVNHCKNNIGKD